MEHGNLEFPHFRISALAWQLYLDTHILYLTLPYLTYLLSITSSDQVSLQR